MNYSKLSSNIQAKLICDIFGLPDPSYNCFICSVFSPVRALKYIVKRYHVVVGNAILYNLVYFCIILNYIHIYII